MSVQVLSRNLPGSDKTGMLKRNAPATKGAKRMLAVFVTLAVVFAGFMTAFFVILYALDLSTELRMLSIVGIVLALGGASGFIVWAVPIFFRRDQPLNPDAHIEWRTLDGDEPLAPEELG